MRSPKYFEFFALTVLLCVMVFTLFVRLNRLDFPLWNGELSRDYLIARHLATFGEVTLTGPSNSVFLFFRSSPAFYWLLAALIKIKDSMMFIAQIHVFLQVLSIGFLYYLGRRLFSPSSGLIAALLFGLSYSSLAQSDSAWNPVFMQPFILLSFCCLAKSYLDRNYPVLLFGLFLLIFSETFHHSAFSLFPLYFALSLYVTHKITPKIKYKIGVVATFAWSSILFYAPVFLNLYKEEKSLAEFQKGETKLSLGTEFFLNIQTNTTRLLEPYFSFSTTLSFVLLWLFAFFLVFALIRADKEARLRILVLGAFVLQPLLIVSILGIKTFGYYFIPVSALVLLLIALSLDLALKKHLVLIFAKVLVVVLFLQVFSVNFQTLRIRAPGGYYQNLTQEAINAVRDSLFEIKEKERRPDFNFFQVKMLTDGTSNIAHEALLYAPLEKDLDARFVEVTNTGNGYGPINMDDYIFVVCVLDTPGSLPNEWCNPKKLEGRYSIESLVFNKAPLVVYLAKKDG